MAIKNKNTSAFKESSLREVKYKEPIEHIGDGKVECISIRTTPSKFLRTEQLSLPKKARQQLSLPSTTIKRNTNFDLPISRMEWIQSRSAPKQVYTISENQMKRGKSQPLDQLNPRISLLSQPKWRRSKFIPPTNMESFISEAEMRIEESRQVPNAALTYIASKRIEVLAKPHKRPDKNENNNGIIKEKPKVFKTDEDRLLWKAERAKRLYELSKPRRILKLKKKLRKSRKII